MRLIHLFGRLLACAIIIATVAQPAFAQSDSRTVSGVVADEDGAPLAGAVVQVVGTDIQATADASGAFTLQVPTGDVVVTVGGLEGYAAAEVILDAGSDKISVELARVIAKTRTITGRVVDSATGEPVVGALVTVKGSSLHGSTDGGGFFLIDGAPADAVTIEIKAAGYGAEQAAIPDGRNSAHVPLTATTAAEEPVKSDRRTISGRVTEELTGEPIPGATVIVEGTDKAAITDDTGAYVIEDVPNEPVTLNISGASYGQQQVPVLEGVAEFDVKLEYADGEQILVTGRAPQISRKNLANGASVVKGDDISRVSAQTVDDSLSGKVAGANIQRNSGAPGGGVQVSLRGVSTINGQNSPLYVIDGVIVSNVAIPSGLSAVTASTRGSNSSANQDNQVNRIADINPNDIESVEILKGAAAAALYGSKASNGVIIITTKRGKRGAEPRVSVTQRLGVSTLNRTLGSRKIETMEEAMEAFGENGAAAFAASDGQNFNHEREIFGRTDVATETIASITGGLANTSYFGSFLVKDEPGILKGTGYQKQSARVGFTQDFGKKFRLGVTTNLVHSNASRGLTQNDNAGVSHYMVLAATPSIFDIRRRPDGTFAPNPFIGSTANPLQTIALMNDDEEVWRFIGAANANFKAYEDDTHLVNMAATLGVDWFQQENDLFFPPDLFFEPNDGLPGTSIDTNAENLNLNFNLNTSYQLTPSGAPLKAVTTAGLLFEERKLDTVYITSRNLNAAQPNVGSGASVDVTEARLLVRDRGAYLQEEVLLLDDDLSFVAALLAEQSSANGNENRVYLYPKAQVAYKLPKLSEEISLLRFRGSYGEAGNQPLYGQKFTPLNATGNIEGTPGLVNGGVIGDPDIKPERQREVEMGVDFTGFDDRAVAELTVYQKNVSDLLLERTLAPSSGFQSQFFNGGELRNRGIEAMVQVTPIKNNQFEWMSRTIFTINRSKIVDLPGEAFLTGGFGTSLGAFRIEEGASATQIVGNNGVDEDGNPIISKIGDTEPTFRMSFVNNFTYGDLSLSSLWDWQQGGNVINLTRFLYDLNGNTVDFEENGMARLARQETHADAYVESATFLKLREVSVSYKVPKEIVDLIGPMESASVSLSGRNLLTFSKYSGLDPEVSNFGNQAIARNIDVAPYPAAQSYWFSITANF